MSELNIGKAIKKLRREMDVTQEELAAAVGVTSQAVSKWEREEGYPDITLLPNIAGYFGVTFDTVCGLDAEREKEEIEKIIADALKEDECRKSAVILRKGLEKYPHSFRLKSELAYQLVGCTAENYQENLEEAIRIYENILEKCTDTQIRNIDQANICIAYKRAGYHDKALAAAKSLPNIYKTMEIELCEILSGEELVDSIQDGIQRWVWCLYYWVKTVCRDSSHYTADEKISLYQKVINVYETIYEKRDHLFGLKRVTSCYHEMSKIALEAGRTDECIAYLDKAAEFALLCEAYDLKGKPTSLLINAVDIGNTWRESAKKEKEHLYDELATDSQYDDIREIPEFMKIIEKLK